MNSELEKFELRLKSIDLPAAQVDRNQLMYSAGWAAALANLQDSQIPVAKKSGGNRFWPTSTLVASLVAVLLGILLLIQPEEPDASNQVAALPRKAIRTEKAIPIVEVQQESLPDELLFEDPENDILNYIANIPSGQVLNAGVGIGALSTANMKVPFKVPASRLFQAPTMNQKQILNALLPPVSDQESQPSRTWQGFLLPINDDLLRGQNDG